MQRPGRPTVWIYSPSGQTAQSGISGGASAGLAGLDELRRHQLRDAMLAVLRIRVAHDSLFGPYAASKAAVVAMTETLHNEIGDRLTVTVACPSDFLERNLLTAPFGSNF